MRRFEHAQHRVIGFARMDDKRQSGFLRGLDMGGEDPFLIVARRKLVMKVEAAFADPDNVFLAGEIDQTLRRQPGMIACIMRMRADLTPDERIARGNFADGVGR